MNNDGGLDLLAVESFTWHLEIACEICLREAAAGRRVGFAFLDVINVDEFPLDTLFAAQVYAARHSIRLAKVRAIEQILRSRGVTVITAGSAPPGARLSCAGTGTESIAALRDLRVGGAAIGLGVVSSLIRYSADIDPDFGANRALIDRMLTSAYQVFHLTRQLIDHYRPTAILVFNGRLACTKAVSEAARIAGVESFYYEVGGAYDRYYFSSRPPQSSENARELLRRAWAGAGVDRVSVAEQYFARGRGGAPLRETAFVAEQLPGRSVAPTGRRRIVYYVSSIDEYVAVEEGVEHVLFDSQRAAVRWLIGWVGSRPDTELVIRVHPRMRRLSLKERDWWASLAAANVIVLPAESPVDSYALADSADRVLCYHSSMCVEATYLEKVAILLGDASYRGLDCVYEPDSLGALVQLLEDNAVPPKPREHCLPFGYYRMRRGEEFKFFRPTECGGGDFFGVPVASGKMSLTGRVRNKVLWILLPVLQRFGRPTA